MPATERIQSYVDLAAVKKETDIFRGLLRDLVADYDKVNQTKVKLAGATTGKDIAAAMQAGAAASANFETKVREGNKALSEQAQKIQELKVKNAELANAIKEQTLERQKAIEADRVADREAQRTRQQEREDSVRRKAENTDALRGYNAIVQAKKELYKPLKNAEQGDSINFRGDVLSMDAAIAKYRELSLAEQAFRRQFQKDGTLVGEYTTGIIQAFKQLGLGELVGAQIVQAKDKLNDLNGAFDVLKAELVAVKAAGAGGFESIEKALIDNRKEAQALQATISSLNKEYNKSGDVSAQISSGIAKGFKEAKTQAVQLLASYVGLQAAFQGVVSSIDTAGTLADQTTSLEIELGKAAGGASELVAQLAKLDTRTKLTVLEDIANIAARAGVSEKNLVGVTQALDKIKIAFGADFGNVEEGTESLVKLINIFEGSDQVTGENLLKVGNAVRTLANESVASVPFLNDFSKRMAGLKGISDISLPAVLGLASGFEQFGQSAEVASTALVQIIPKLANDTEKFSKIAGVTREAFSDLLANNPAEALIKVSEGLTAGKGSIEEISAAFADSELGRGRVTTILATLADKSDDFRKSISSATVAYQNTNNITDAFAAKNNNLAATLDKIAKRFADAAGSKGFQITLAAIAGLVTLIIGNLGTLATVLGVLAAGWAINNRQLVILRAQMLLYNAGILIMRTTLAAVTVAQGAYNAMMALYTGVARGATVATTLLGTAMRLLPIGIILTIAAVLVATFRAMAGAVAGTTAELRRQAIQQQINNDISARAGEATAEQLSKTQSYLQVLKAEGVSLETKKKILGDLIDQAPEYLNGLTLANVSTQEGTNIVNRYIDALRNKAAEEAAQAIRTEKIKKDLSLGLLQQKLETQVATKKNTDLGDLTDEEKEFVGSSRKNFAFTASVTDKFTGSSAAAEAVAAIKAARATLVTEIDQTDEIIKQKYQSVSKSAAATVTGTVKGAVSQVEVDITALKNELDALNKQIDSFRGSQKDLDALTAKRNKAQAAYEAALNKQKGGRQNQLSALKAVEEEANDDELKRQADHLKSISDNETFYYIDRRNKRQQAFDIERNISEREYSLAVKNAAAKLKATNADPNSDTNDRINAQNEFNAEVEKLTAKHNVAMGVLVTDLGDDLRRIANQSNQQRLDDEKKTNAEFSALFKQQTDDRLKAVLDAAEKESTGDAGNQTEEIERLNRRYLRQIALAGTSEKAKTKLAEAYGKERSDIEERYARRAIELQIRVAEGVIAESKRSGIDTAKQEKDLYDLRVRYSDLTIENAIKKGKRLNQEQTKNAQELESDLGKFADIYGKVSEIGGGLLNAVAIKQKNELQDQIDLIEKKKLAEIEAINASGDAAQVKADKIAVIEARAAAQREQIEMKQRQADQRRAQFEKLLNIGKIGIEGALAVVHQLTTGDPYTAIGRAIAAGIFAGAQLAVAIATPIPKYKMGTKNHRGGAAIVGDGGKREPIKEPGKPMYLSPAESTLVDLPAGTMVWPDVEAAIKDRFSMALNFMPQQRQAERPDDRLLQSIEKGLTGVRYAIQNQTRVKVSNTFGGVKVGYEQQRRYWEWVNKQTQS